MQSTLSAAPTLSLSELEAYDPQGKGRGREKIYRCPVCQSDERALHVNHETGLWNCKRASCGAKGKLKDFWQERPKFSGRERARVALHRAFSTGEARPKSEPETAATWREYFANSIPIEGTPGAKYLAGRGIPEPIASAAGVHYSPNLYGRPAVVFPFHDQSGAPCALLARHSDGKPDGHRALGCRSDGIFTTAPDALKADALRGETVVICEAPADALSLAACGVAVIALGCTRAPDWLPQALAFRKVLLAFDNDANGAGDAGAGELEAALLSFGASVARLRPYRAPDETKSDWNAMLQAYGARLVQAHLRDELREAGALDWLAIGDSFPARREVYASELYDPQAAREYALSDESLTPEQRANLLAYADAASARSTPACT